MRKTTSPAKGNDHPFDSPFILRALETVSNIATAFSPSCPLCSLVSMMPFVHVTSSKKPLKSETEQAGCIRRFKSHSGVSAQL